jgi:hypothetical protein
VPGPCPFLLDLDPGQLAPLPVEFVALARQFSFLGQKRDARLTTRNDSEATHRNSSAHRK